MKPKLFIFSLLCICGSSLFAQLSGPGSDTRPRRLYSFGITVGSGWTNNALGYFQTYVQRVIQGSENENLRLTAVVRDPNYNRYLDEDVTFGMQIGLKFPLKNRWFHYVEVPVGLSMYRFHKDLLIENTTYIRQPTYSSIHARIAAITPSLGVVVHSKPVLKNMALCAGVEAGFLYGRYGHNREENNGINGSGRLSYTLAADARAGLAAGIKYNASCDLNLELYYVPYVIFNTVTQTQDNAAFFQAFRLLIRYKLYQNLVNPDDRRVDVFF